MKIYKKAILPLGFKANALACGIKKSGKMDLALLYSEVPAKAGCQFTTNTIQAAPIKISRRNLKAGKNFRAIIVNSGNANCFTGPAGLRDAQKIVKATACALGVKKEEVLAASTGIIGKKMPLDKIKKAIPQLAEGLCATGIAKAKKAIMTTDTFAKEVSLNFKIAGKRVTLCAIAKGAGMIAPHMATMLCFILTDASITQSALNKALSRAVDNSFNCISVDGCMSTNDSVMCLANGAAGNPAIGLDNKFALFFKALNLACLELAKMIVRDAEGATKFISVTLKEAKSFQEAKKVALGIANSSLFKTALYGENPNFGRIIAAIGASRVAVKEEEIKIKASPLNKKDIAITVFLKNGKSSAVVFTCDLTPEYIKINAGYN